MLTVNKWTTLLKLTAVITDVHEDRLNSSNRLPNDILSHKMIDRLQALLSLFRSRMTSFADLHSEISMYDNAVVGSDNV